MLAHAIYCKNVTKVFYEKKKKNNRYFKSNEWLNLLRPKKTRFNAVNNISFTVSRGEIFGIVGPNGSGKSTLVRLLSTLLLPDGGEIKIFGKDVVKNYLEVRRLINRVSVEAAFFKQLSAWENLSYAARLYGVKLGTAKQKVTQILYRLGLNENKINEPLKEFSRGMQQKVAIARALLTSPVLLLLDEPTTGLDPKSKRDVHRFVLEIRRTHDTTVLITTHDMEEADRICDRIAIMDNGRFVAIDTPGNLKRKISDDICSITLEDVFLQLTGKNWQFDTPEEEN